MTVKVLGPLDTGTEPLRPRERAILSALLVRMGTAMSLGELADAYWGERVPSTWGQQVKTAVGRIRARMGPHTIVTTAAGYHYGADPDSVDAVRFERLVSAARGHALRGQHDRAAESYRRALALWRGAPYPDLTEWEPAIVEQRRLTEIRTSAEEELLEARLADGEHRTVIPDAERLVREQPLREDRWAILALANYRTDRQAEALAVVRAARSRLLDELGIEPGHRLTELEVAILRQDPALAAPAPVTVVSADCPYRGLQSFGPQDADVFFGRDFDVDRVMERVQPGALVGITGPSGSGKSSVLLAGVAPRVREQGRTVEVLGAGVPGLPASRQAIARAGATGVIAVDQAEEVVAALSADDLEEFCRAAREHLDGGGSIVATIRSDFLDRATALPHVGAAVARDVVVLGPLSDEGLRAAIEGAVLPHLSHALVETWVRREGTTLTVDGYEAAGGIAGGIAQSAEALYRSLSPRRQELARSLLLRLVERGADRTTVRRPVPVERLQADPERRGVVEGLAAARLVAIDGGIVLIAHEAVATAWPRLDDWLDQDAEGMRLLRQLESSAAAWDSGGRGEEELLRGVRLHAVLDWCAAADPDLTEAEQALLDASEEHELAELRELQDRARQQRRQNRRLRFALAGAAGLLVVALAAGGTAVFRSTEAAASREDALRENLVSTSLALRGSDRDVSALLAAEAYKRWPDHPSSRAALMGTMTSVGGFIGGITIPDVVGRVGTALIPGSRTLIVARSSGELELRDLDTMELRRSLEPMPPATAIIRPWLYPSADGSTLAVFRQDRDPAGGPGDVVQTGYVYDLRSGRSILDEPLRIDGASDSIAISANGRFVAWVEWFSGDLVVVETATGMTHAARGLTPPVGEANPGVPVFSTDGKLLVGSADGRVLEVDQATLEVTRTSRAPVEAASLALAPLSDGTVVTAGHRGVTRLDPGSDSLLWKHEIGQSRPFECGRLLVSERYGLVFCADQEGLIEVRSLESGVQVSAPLSFEGGAIGGQYFLDGGDTLVATSAQSAMVSLWRIDGSGPVSRLVAPGLMLSDGYDPTGRYLVAGTLPTDPSAGGSPADHSVWDAVAGTKVRDLAPGERPTWIGTDRLLVLKENPTDPELPGSLSVIDLRGGAPSDAGDLTPDMLEYGISPADGSIYGVFRSGNGEAPPTFEVRVFDGTTLRATGLEIDFGGAVPLQPSFTPDGSLVSFVTWQQRATPWETRVFDTASGELVARGLTAQGGSVVLPTGEVVGSSADRLAVYSGSTLERSRALPRPPAPSDRLIVSADGRTLLVWSYGEHGVSVYDLAGGERLGDSLTRGPDGVGDLRADGLQFAYSAPRGLAVWDLDPAHHFEAACRIAGRELNADEWATYLAEFGPQRPTCS